MGENYGGTFAQKLISQDKYEEAITAASEDADRSPDDPWPLFDRATALAALERHAEAVVDFERALVLDEEAASLETDFVDDALFGALLGEARKSKDLAFALGRLSHYRKIFPDGRHTDDVEIWSRRLRGEGGNEVIVKER